jgi:hypothetical protein
VEPALRHADVTVVTFLFTALADSQSQSAAAPVMAAVAARPVTL